MAQRLTRSLFRPFSELKKTFLLPEPDLQVDNPIDKEGYLGSWEMLTERELAEVMKKELLVSR